MSQDAGTLHCPNCGAAAAPAAGRCPYCHARLATVSCPSCFGLLFEGAAYCPHCGAKRERQSEGEAPGACPGCRGPLARVEVGSTALVECERCDGIWLDAEAFERLCADRETQAAVLHRIATAARTPAGPIRYRPCPRCGKLMNRVNFAKASGVIVDVCRGHGTFLDAGELHQIVTFIHGGGLDRAREQEREALAEEERRLRSLQNVQSHIQMNAGDLSIEFKRSLSFEQLLRHLFES
jgi:Zn-finger nucleic acid-binding protein